MAGETNPARLRERRAFYHCTTVADEFTQYTPTHNHVHASPATDILPITVHTFATFGGIKCKEQVNAILTVYCKGKGKGC